MISRISLSLAFTIGCVLAGDGQASVLVVDSFSSPGAQFTTIQSAIQAAADGDVILVRNGPYNEAISFADKDLTLQSDGGIVQIAPFSCQSPMTIQGLSAGKRVVVRGFVFSNAFCIGSNPPPPQWIATDNLGTIWIDECVGVRFSITNCSEVVLTNSSVGGGGNSAALSVTSSNLFIHGSTVVGQSGLDGSDYLNGFPQPHGGFAGGPALLLQGASSALISNSKLTGGDGGDGWFMFWCLDPGIGGPAIKLGTGDPIVRSMSSTLKAGEAGAPYAGCSPIPTGPDFVVETGSIVQTPGNPKEVWIESPVRELDSIIIQITDVSNSNILFLFSTTSASVPLPQYGGALHLGSPLFVVPLGTIPSHGTMTLQLPVPNLPTGLQGLVVFTQAASCPPASPCALTAPEAIVILDSSL